MSAKSSDLDPISISLTREQWDFVVNAVLFRASVDQQALDDESHLMPPHRREELARSVQKAVVIANELEMRRDRKWFFESLRERWSEK